MTELKNLSQVSALESLCIRALIKLIPTRDLINKYPLPETLLSKLKEEWEVENLYCKETMFLDE